MGTVSLEEMQSEAQQRHSEKQPMRSVPPLFTKHCHLQSKATDTFRHAEESAGKLADPR